MTCLALLLLAGTAASAHAQCQSRWFPTGSRQAGVNGTVYSSTLWDPDGPGPQEPYFVAAGNFTQAEGGTTGSIFAIRGREHLDFGAGLTGTVYALATFNNQLYAGGAFLLNGLTPGHIARWDGSQWQPVGGGIDQTVLALTTYGGRLIAGGLFANAGGQPAPAIAQWDGANWSSVGGGVDVDVVSLCTHGGELIAGGTFQSAGGQAASNIAAWNGTSWHALGAGISGESGIEVKALASHDGALYAGGFFSSAGDQPAANLAKWDGQAWVPAPNPGGVVRALTSHQGSLFAISEPSPSDSPVLRLDGAAWTQIGGSGDSRTILGYQGLLILGSASAASAGISAGLKSFSGELWHAFGSGGDGTIYALAYYNGEIVAGGNFTLIGGRPIVSLAASPNGVDWHSLGGDAVYDDINTGQTTPGTIYALLARPEGLYFAGVVFRIGQTPLSTVGLWNGSVWDPLLQGLTAGLAGSMLEYNGDIAMAGSMFSNYGVQCNHIVRWTGSTWGIYAPVDIIHSHGVNALGKYNGNLLLSGDDFDSLPTNIAQWDGTQWTAFTPITGSAPLCFANFNGQLYSGQFSNTAAHRVTRFDGAQWHDTAPLPSNTTGVKAVYALAVHNGELYAGGTFREVNPGGLAGVARWDGAAWQPLGSGGQSSVRALLSVNDDLWVGGSFLTVDGLPSLALGRWSCACYPNCDNSTSLPILNANDFQCFLNKFAAGDSSANCDGSINPPVLNANDFQCFVNKFAAGCN